MMMMIDTISRPVHLSIDSPRSHDRRHQQRSANDDDDNDDTDDDNDDDDDTPNAT